MVVKELLQLLIGEVDTQLLETVELLTKIIEVLNRHRNIELITVLLVAGFG